MGTAAFDRAWGSDSQHGDALDAVWDAPHLNAAEQLHAEYKKGLLGKRMARENANDQDAAAAESVSLPAAAGHALAATGANFARGIPGMTAVEAGARSVVRGQPYREALSDVEGATDKIPDYVRGGERMVGALPLSKFLPANPAAAGAVLLGADQALSPDPDQTLVGRAARTAAGAAAGAVGGKALKGVANVAQRTGLTDAIGSQLSKLGGKAADIAEAIGTRGAGNRLLSQRQQVADEISGSEQSAAQTMLDHVQHYKEQAGQLYDAAKQDKAVVNHPRVQKALADPRMQQMLDIVRGRLGFSPNPTVIREGIAGAEAPHVDPTFKAVRTDAGRLTSGLQRVSDEDLEAEINRLAEKQAMDGGQVAAHFEHPDTEAAINLRSTGYKEDAAGLVDPKTHQKFALLRSQYDQRQKALERLQAEAERRQAALPEAEHGASDGDTSFGFGANIVGKPAVPPVVADLPSPEELAMTKRLVSSIVQQKFGAPQGLNAAEAAQLAPLLDDLRAGLHESSPAWKAADHFYAQAKNFETAYQKAFGVQQKVTASGLDPSKLKTPEALAAWIAKAKGSTAIARASGVQAGTAGRLGEAVRAAPLGTDIAETLRGANGVFQPSPAAAAVRRGAFSSGQDAQRFAGLVSQLTSQGEQQAASYGPQHLSASANPLTLFGAGKALTPQNPLATPAGTALRHQLAAALADPAQATALRAQLSRSQEGMALLRQLLTGSIAAGNAPFAP